MSNVNLAMALPDAAVGHFSKVITEWGENNSCTEFLRGFFSGDPPNRATITWLLRHWAVLATVRNSSALMTSTLSLAGACHVAMASVVLQLEASMRPAGLLPPEGVVHCVDALPGFAFARCANPSTDGSLDIVINKSFRERVCGLDALRKCWSANEREMLSLFIHEEDISILPRETGIFLARQVIPLTSAINSPEPLVHPTQRVVRLKVDGSYIACHMVIKACSVDAIIYFGFFLTPVSTPSAQADASYTLLELMQLPALVAKPSTSADATGCSANPMSSADPCGHLGGAINVGQVIKDGTGGTDTQGAPISIVSSSELLAAFDVMGW